MTATRQMLYVLALFEAGLTILTALGQVVTMGSPGYVVVGLVEAALYVVGGVAASRGRRYGAVILIVGAGVGVVGLWFSVILGALPAVDLPFTVSAMLDGAVLPLAVMALAARSLAAPPAGPAQTTPLPVPEPEAALVETGASR